MIEATLSAMSITGKYDLITIDLIIQHCKRFSLCSNQDVSNATYDVIAEQPLANTCSQVSHSKL